MSFHSKSLRVACLLVAIAFAGAAQAQTTEYAISGGAQAQIGGGLPLPVQAATNPVDGGKLSMGGAIGTGMNFPPLLIPAIPLGRVKQTNGVDPKQMTVQPGQFFRLAPGPLFAGVQLNNPNVMQVRTNILFSGPGNFGRRRGRQRGVQEGLPRRRCDSSGTAWPRGWVVRHLHEDRQPVRRRLCHTRRRRDADQGVAGARRDGAVRTPRFRRRSSELRSRHRVRVPELEGSRGCRDCWAR